MQSAPRPLQDNLTSLANVDLLSDELLLEFMRFLKPRDLASLAKTNRHFAALVKEELSRRLLKKDQTTIAHYHSFFKLQTELLNDFIEDTQPELSCCHPAENACLGLVFSSGLLAAGIYMRDYLPLAIPLDAAAIIGLLASILLIIKHCRSDMAVNRAYQRIDTLEKMEAGLNRQLRC